MNEEVAHDEKEETIHDRILIARDANGKSNTQQAIADDYGVDQSSVSKWLHGIREPSKALLTLISEKEGCDLIWLWTGLELSPATQKLIAMMKDAPESKQDAIVGAASYILSDKDSG